ncbi:putative fatty acyl-CoA reductase CG8306 [Rhodnius prolixus]|uniref:Fatty acyl-CoA reductase n=1 Tax=Rhodnius prolixus TaxID=13249 RepID=T1IBM7_RHOPR
MPEGDVKSFYNGKNVFITGGTGFVGIALVEKLLRTTEVNKIYLLVRPKRDKEIYARLEEYIKNPIFSVLKEEKGSEVFTKLSAVQGDVGEDNLGLSNNDKQTLIDNVNIVFHCAATLDFEADLKCTVKINLLGTRRVVELCKKIKNLNGLLHVSSAYVNSHLLRVDEKLYPVPESADKVIELVESTPDKELEEKTKQILGKYINTYTFTKALAEIEVTNSVDLFPSCIVRPSMIVAAWKEPIPGWTNSKNGPQGFIMGAAKGVVRRLPVDPKLVCDYIPVDVVVNGIIVGAWKAAISRPSETLIFHLTSSTYKPFKWNIVAGSVDRLLHKYPLKSAVWYPTLKLLPSLFVFKLSALFFHWIPAYFLDAVTALSGGRPILRKLHSNINKSLDRLQPFIFTEWFFSNKKTMELHNSLSEQDKENFTLDLGPLVWRDYFENMAKGVRQFLHKEEPSSLEYAKKKDTIFLILNIILQVVIMSSIWFLFSTISGKSLTDCFLVLPITLIIFGIL